MKYNTLEPFLRKNFPGRSPWFTKLKLADEGNEEKILLWGQNVCLSGCRLSINVQGVIFNRSGSNLNPICISKLSRGTFFLFLKFSFFDLFWGNFRKFQGHFFKIVIEGWNFDTTLFKWNTLKLIFIFFEILIFSRSKNQFSEISRSFFKIVIEGWNFDTIIF